MAQYLLDLIANHAVNANEICGVKPIQKKTMHEIMLTIN